MTLKWGWMLCGALLCALTSLTWYWPRDLCSPASRIPERSHCVGNFGLSMFSIILVHICVVPGLIWSLNGQVILVNWRADWFGIEGASVGSVEEVIQSVMVNWMYQVFSCQGSSDYPSLCLLLGVLKTMISIAEFTGGLGNS